MSEGDSHQDSNDDAEATDNSNPNTGPTVPVSLIDSSDDDSVSTVSASSDDSTKLVISVRSSESFWSPASSSSSSSSSSDDSGGGGSGGSGGSDDSGGGGSAGSDDSGGGTSSGGTSSGGSSSGDSSNNSYYNSTYNHNNNNYSDRAELSGVDSNFGLALNQFFNRSLRNCGCWAYLLNSTGMDLSPSEPDASAGQHANKRNASHLRRLFDAPDSTACSWPKQARYNDESQSDDEYSDNDKDTIAAAAESELISVSSSSSSSRGQLSYFSGPNKVRLPTAGAAPKLSAKSSNTHDLTGHQQVRKDEGHNGTAGDPKLLNETSTMVEAPQKAVDGDADGNAAGNNDDVGSDKTTK